MTSEEEVLVDVSLEDVCPICLEKEGSLFTPSCKHLIHLDCAKQMTDPICPMCRGSLEGDLPEEILTSIQENHQRYQNHLEAEDRQRLASSQMQMGRMMAIYVRPRPFVEVRYALDYLRQQGVPLGYLPQRITIKLPANHPKPQPGVIFSTLIGQAVERMEKDANQDDSDTEDESGGSDSEENPFESEDQRLQHLAAQIEVMSVNPVTFTPLRRRNFRLGN